ncbi:protein phosphatase 1 regulatory subunit 15B [Mantella aurantiaca]
MFADRNNRSSPGLRALLGRFVYSLFPQRLFQRVGAAWSYLMGPWDASSFLTSGWLVNRSVRSVELPKVLEAFGLRSGSWEELGECFDELGPWKEMLTPEVGVDADLLKLWKAVSFGKNEAQAFNELTAWQKAMVRSNMQVFWEPGLTWIDDVEPNLEDKECHKTASAAHTFSLADQVLGNELEACKVGHEKRRNQLQSYSLDIIYLLNVGSGGVLARVELKDDQNIDAIGDNPQCEIQHIRDKRLRFLQPNKTEYFPSDLKQENGKREQSRTIVPDLPVSQHESSPNEPVSYQNLQLSLSECPGGRSKRCQQCELLWDVSLTHGNVLEIPEINVKCSSDQLPFVVHDVDKPCNHGHIGLSSDKDQGYHSLEYWQCSPPPQNYRTAKIETCETCELNRESVVLFPLPTGLPAFPSLVKDKNDRNGEDTNSDLQDKIPNSSVNICTNKYIGYILGTVVSDDDDCGTSSSSCNDWDKEDDDGFGSEGSLSITDHETSAPEDVLWNSFCSADPYNLQNFPASFQTGVLAEENVLSLESQDRCQPEEESWCDSNAESDSESDCSAEEEENIKLWNAFLKSDDPYNPLYFKAPVQTSDKIRQSTQIASTYSEAICRPLPDHKVTCQKYDLHQQLLKETNNVEDCAKLGPKKVTFHEKVTIYYVCDEERKGHWEELARDRCRFQRRIQETEFVIGLCLTPDHRKRAWERMQLQWGSPLPGSF